MHKHVDTQQSSVVLRGLQIAVRLIMAGAIIAAVAWQLHDKLSVPSFNVWNFFSYFTIQSNIIGALVLLCAVGLSRQPGWFGMVRGAATLYLAVTGVVYALLLAHYNVGITAPWVNDVLHRIAPVIVVVDWLLFPPAKHLLSKKVLWWLAYPILWLIYTLIRGSIEHWYPYPFVDPRESGGYLRVGLYVVAITAFAIAAAYTLAGLAGVVNRSKNKG